MPEEALRYVPVRAKNIYDDAGRPDETAQAETPLRAAPGNRVGHSAAPGNRLTPSTARIPQHRRHATRGRI